MTGTHLNIAVSKVADKCVHIFCVRFYIYGQFLRRNIRLQQFCILVFPQIIILSHEDYISIKVVFYSSNTTDEIPKFDLTHIAGSVSVARNKKIVCRKINAFNQGARAKDRFQITAFKTALYAQSDICGKVSHMISNSSNNKIGKIAIVMHLRFDFCSQCV